MTLHSVFLAKTVLHYGVVWWTLTKERQAWCICKTVSLTSTVYGYTAHHLSVTNIISSYPLATNCIGLQESRTHGAVNGVCREFQHLPWFFFHLLIAMCTQAHEPIAYAVSFDHARQVQTRHDPQAWWLCHLHLDSLRSMGHCAVCLGFFVPSGSKKPLRLDINGRNVIAM